MSHAIRFRNSSEKPTRVIGILTYYNDIMKRHVQYDVQPRAITAISWPGGIEFRTGGETSG